MSSLTDVLVVDDNELQLEFLEHLFASHGLTAHLTADSKNAIDIIKKVKPRVILLDIMMPGVDGFTVLKTIRESPGLKDIPVIIHTSKSFQVDQRKALRLGANAYLIKPIKGSEIVNEVKKYL